MKNLTFFTTLLCLFLFTFSCTDTATSTEDTTSTEETSPPAAEESEASEEDMGAAAGGIPMDAITVDSFNNWKNAWETKGQGWMASHNLYAFSMPIVDLKAIIGENVDTSMFFLGFEDKGNGEYTPKLIVAGVKDGHILIDGTKGQYAYDYSNSCPPFCRDTSSTKN